MDDENLTSNISANKVKGRGHGGSGMAGGFYFMGFIGAAIFYIQNSGTFWLGVLGFLKAIVWPAFLVYDLLKFLIM